MHPLLRTMTNTEFYAFCIPIAFIAAAGIAALSFIINMPFLN